jgi:hypothetical protein
MNGGNEADAQAARMNTPFLLEPIPSQTAADAYTEILMHAGAVLPVRDTLDQRIITNVKERTGKIIDVQGGYPHGTPYDQTVKAWPLLPGSTPPADDDHDGMPNYWEEAAGLNKADASDRAGISTSGYTQLEVYLNALVPAGDYKLDENRQPIVVAHPFSGRKLLIKHVPVMEAGTLSVWNGAGKKLKTIRLQKGKTETSVRLPRSEGVCYLVYLDGGRKGIITMDRESK